ncbi:hypothetical protein [Ruania alba]|uniref:Cell division protein FtsL n=1 Tax=Ruania alba TaxID=648782 RepID=A0A1H5E990_9MICO|nr:hypothetical protein [Ruania alba]SED87673.1 hypothetical protein SAMN04488554_0937 [Ruania alba]
MSALPLRAFQAPPGRGSAAGWRPRLRLVRAPEPGRSRAPFIVMCLGILGAALLGVLLLNTAMAATSYQIHEQRIELAQLTETQQGLAHEADRRASPTQLEQAARRIGMEPAEDMRYLVLEDQSILGEGDGLVSED